MAHFYDEINIRLLAKINKANKNNADLTELYTTEFTITRLERGVVIDVEKRAGYPAITIEKRLRALTSKDKTKTFERWNTYVIDSFYIISKEVNLVGGKTCLMTLNTMLPFFLMANKALQNVGYTKRCSSISPLITANGLHALQLGVPALFSIFSTSAGYKDLDIHDTDNNMITSRQSRTELKIMVFNSFFDIDQIDKTCSAHGLVFDDSMYVLLQLQTVRLTCLKKKKKNTQGLPQEKIQGNISKTSVTSSTTATAAGTGVAPTSVTATGTSESSSSNLNPEEKQCCHLH
ncbi:hypothetical protein K501DRAFT_302948 [Backusella circina FSU 941]|nr:hypothetical protein K501DRAFT_302948 [Backusella circina FSU 941]